MVSSSIDSRSPKGRANNQVSDEIELHCGVPQRLARLIIIPSNS